jgi:hypothetical protein
MRALTTISAEEGPAGLPFGAIATFLLLAGPGLLLGSCSKTESANSEDGSYAPAWSEEAGPMDPAEFGSGVPEWSEEQRAAMEDGTVTSEEYHEGFRRYAACMSDKGFGVAMVDDRGDRIEAAIPDAAVQNGADAFCYEREFRGVDTLWQLTHPDPALTERLRSCLEQLGLDVPDTQDEMIDVLRANGINPGNCEETTNRAGS